MGDPKPIRLRLSRARGFDLQAASLAANGLPAINCARPQMAKPCEVRGDYALVPLTRGKFALIDAADVGLVSPFNWFACEVRKTGKFYAARTLNLPAGRRTIRMHQIILPLPNEWLVDHIDGDGLNNRRRNLRVATGALNLMNRGAQANNSSGFKGVCWYAAGEKWHAQITREGKNHHIGYFETAEEAAHAYDAEAEVLFGRFGRLNFECHADVLLEAANHV